MHGAAALSQGLLLEEFGLYASPAVSGYRHAVAAKAKELDIEVDHTLALVQIRLELPSAPEFMIGWRVDTGWYVVSRCHGGEPTALSPTRYRAGADCLDQLIPEPGSVAAWLHQVHTRRWTGGRAEPAQARQRTEIRAVLDRLRGYLVGHQHRLGQVSGGGKPVSRFRAPREH